MKTEANRSKFIFDGREIAKVFSQLAAFDSEYDSTSAGTAITEVDFTGVNDGLGVVDLTGFQTIVKAVLATLASVEGRDTVIETYKNV